MNAPAFVPLPSDRFEMVDQLRRRIDAFHAAYCDALDNGRLTEWPSYFTEDTFYRVIAREIRASAFRSGGRVDAEVGVHQ